MATNFPASLDSLTNPTSGDTLASPSHAGQHADANDAIEALQAKVGINGSAVTTSLDYKVAQAATLTGTQTLTNKTLTAPVISQGTFNGAKERWNVSSSSIGGSAVNVDLLTSTAWLYTTIASANWAINLRGDSTTALGSILSVNDSITVAYAVPQGATPYRPTSFLIDSSPVSVRWQGGSAPSAGNASSTDVYVYTVIKTAANVYTVFASQTRFA